jgi:histone H1/5
MARKKPARKKKTVSRRKTTLKKSAARRAASVRKKTAKRAAPKKLAARKKPAAKKKSAAKKKPAVRKATRRRAEVINPVTPSGRRGLGPESGGQSGDTQGLSRRSYDDSESVEELMEEGQYMEAEAVSGVENAPDADQGEVRTRQFPEDDVPEEYQNED